MGRAKRWLSLATVADPANKVQIYISRSLDPYLNLSIEHYFLQKSPPDSAVLFLYMNRPCVVIGRNQNPWLEVNLGLLRRAPPAGEPAHQDDYGHEWEGPETAPGGDGGGLDVVDLVRRRSGGGTVFHDLGNANYSVLCPPAEFDRDKHAEMVVRALRRLGADTARVNERHDIVIHDDHHIPAHTTKVTGRGQAQAQSESHTQMFKVSGSAYKLTRNRSLHHGTCLLSSPNLGAVSRLLHSPAEPYVKARGVASVRSPIRNVGIVPRAFRDAVVAEFRALYSRGEEAGPEVFVGAHEALVLPEIAKGYRELKVSDVHFRCRGTSPPKAPLTPESCALKPKKSQEWIYTQTPQFTLSTHPTADDPRPRPTPPADYLPRDFQLEMTVRHGQITALSGSRDGLPGSLVSTYLHEVADWRTVAGDERVGRWLNEVLGNVVVGR